MSSAIQRPEVFKPAASSPTSAPVFDYEMEGDWELLWTCNYRCPYCFVSLEKLGSKIRTSASPEQWAAAFDATGKRWLIHMTGGEPTIYPDFPKLCEALTRRHLISLNSNLSRPTARALASRVDPRRVSFVNAGLHPGERLRRNGFEAFANNARFLRDTGFRVFVTAVATPIVIANLPALAASCAAQGLHIAPKILRTPYEGKLYPWAYTREQKNRLRTYIARAREHYTRVYEGWPRPSIDVLSDDEFLDGLPNFRGRSCSAGVRFVGISHDGEVHRCNPARSSMGNLLQGTVRFAEAPSPCDTSYCFYFCKKYAAPVQRSAQEPAPAVAFEA
jgi:MoaA/NifB/PqqE/SkfB family radical SAM enzyme